MTLLSFAHSRLMKVKAGPSVTPGTYPLEPDRAESSTRPTETTYIFKLRKGVRATATSPCSRWWTRSEALDKHTVEFTLSEPFAWFLDALAATSTWIVAREAVEKFGDLKKPEAVIGTGPWMLLQPVGEDRLGLGALRQELGAQQRIRLRRADDGDLARPLTLAPRTRPARRHRQFSKVGILG